jgi:hypothetical protein
MRAGGSLTNCDDRWFYSGKDGWRRERQENLQKPGSWFSASTPAASNLGRNVPQAGGGIPYYWQQSMHEKSETAGLGRSQAGDWDQQCQQSERGIV